LAVEGRAFSVTCALSVLILVSACATYFWQSPGPLGGDFQISRYQMNQHNVLGNQLLSLVPNNVSVVAQNEYLAHLSERQHIYEVPIPDYRQVEYLFADRTMSWYGVHPVHWKYYLDSGYFDLISEQDGYLVGKRTLPEKSLAIRFKNQMTLVGYSTRPKGTLKGGMLYRPILFWRAETPIGDKYKIAIRILDTQGHLWAGEDREPLGGTWPTERWQAGKIVGDQYSIPLPSTVPAGVYRVVVQVHGYDGRDLLAQDEDEKSLGDEPSVTQIRIEKDKTSVVASDLVKQQPMVALFADMREMRLLGYYPMQETVRLSEPIHFGLYWRARSKPLGDYSVSLQLRDASGGSVYEHSARPANNTYPTLQWDEGEVLLDWHDFQLPASFNPGTYRVFVVLRDAMTKFEFGQIKISELAVIP
jgi:hypothetical protein